MWFGVKINIYKYKGQSTNECTRVRGDKCLGEKYKITILMDER